jgi:hypothetical protein
MLSMIVEAKENENTTQLTPEALCLLENLTSEQLEIILEF